jgi:hypothetical protein
MREYVPKIPDAALCQNISKIMRSCSVVVSLKLLRCRDTPESTAGHKMPVAPFEISLKAVTSSDERIETTRFDSETLTYATFYCIKIFKKAPTGFNGRPCWCLANATNEPLPKSSLAGYDRTAVALEPESVGS